MSSQSPPKITLHTYFRSSCSGRIRIALNLKGLPYDPKYIHLLKSEQTAPEYKAINPSGAVPTITLSQEDEDEFVLTQSLAILEYLDEAFPPPQFTPLLPRSPKDRARVRQLCNIIACDVQPLTNLKMLKKVKEFATAAGQDPDVAGPQWQKSMMADGMRAFETILKTTAGSYCVGDEISMADCCLMPAIDGAVRFGVDMEEFATIQKIRVNLEQVEAFTKAAWNVQGDTPEELRPKA